MDLNMQLADRDCRPARILGLIFDFYFLATFPFRRLSAFFLDHRSKKLIVPER